MAQAAVLVGLRGLDQLVHAAELDPRAAVRLAGLDLGRVDRLPALEGDVVGLALVEQGLDRASVAGELGLGDLPGLEVREELVDGLLGVLLVGPDHAGGAPLDPADRVEARDLLAIAVVDAARLVVDQAAALVEGDALDRDPLVADRAQDQAALDRLALAGVDGTDPAGLVPLELVASRPRSARPCPSPWISTGERRKRITIRLGLPSGSRWEKSVKMSTLRRLVGSASSESSHSRLSSSSSISPGRCRCRRRPSRRARGPRGW